MKTAEEWNGYLATALSGVLPIKDVVKQIQLDAFKAGMTEAAEIVKNKQSNTLFIITYKLACDESSEAILSARDRKESL